MRKFHLKDSVARRLMGVSSGEAGAPDSPLEPVAPEHAEEAAETAATERGKLRAVWRTDVGRIRRSNQDALILGDRLWGVADGMGGHNGGETASQGLRDGLLRELAGQEPDVGLFEKAVQKINLELWEQQEKDASLTGMGTTLTALWADRESMLLAQVGDSRAYLIRDGALTQVTSDHSMVADMVRRGVLTEEQAACHPMRNYITRAVGTEETIDVDQYTVPRNAGDRWLICSDGLYGQMSKDRLTELAAMENLEEAADLLMAAALDNGGKDNISLVLLQDDAGPEIGDHQPEVAES